MSTSPRSLRQVDFAALITMAALVALTTLPCLAASSPAHADDVADQLRFEQMARACALGAKDPALRPSKRPAQSRKFTALFLAIAQNKDKRAHQLAPRRADINALDQVSGATPLTWAAQTAHPAMCDWLLGLDADIEATDSQRHSPLTTAIRYGKTSTVRLLLQRGADPNRATPLGQRPLHFACGKTGSLKITRMLVDAGANPHLPDRSGWTPLSMAAKYGHTAMVEYLLRLGAHPDGTPGSRFTPLHWAAVENRMEVARKLLAAGAAPNPASPEGHTPLSWAKTKEMRALLTPSQPVN